MAAVSASGLTKRFGTTRAVEGVDLVVEEGEVRGLLGPNGAGKTTLLRMLLGLVGHDAGTIELLGRPLDRAGTATLDGVAGFVENPSFYPYLSARANLEVLADLDDAQSRGRIGAALEQVELADRAHDRLSGYSSGMRQRLGIAAALIRAPRLLLLDEPTSGLDPAGVRFMSQLVVTLAASGVAIVLSSHQIGELEAVCDTFSVLRRGHLAWSGTAEALRGLAPSSAYRLLTSDDGRALALAQSHDGVRAERSSVGLSVTAATDAMDSLVLALAQASVAVRILEPEVNPLESAFFALTGAAASPLGPAPNLDTGSGAAG